jgi:hypothetical protein
METNNHRVVTEIAIREVVTWMEDFRENLLISQQLLHRTKNSYKKAFYAKHFALELCLFLGSAELKCFWNTILSATCNKSGIPEEETKRRGVAIQQFSSGIMKLKNLIEDKYKGYDFDQILVSVRYDSLSIDQKELLKEIVVTLKSFLKKGGAYLQAIQQVNSYYKDLSDKVEIIYEDEVLLDDSPQATAPPVTPPSTWTRHS